MTYPAPIRALPLLQALVLAFSLSLGEVAIAQGNFDDPTPPRKLTPEEKSSERAARDKLAAKVLEKLYQVDPKSKELVDASAGYAVFDIASIYAILFVGQKGSGVMIDNATKKPTYMLSARVGTGPGVGAQRAYQVFVFKSKGAMEQFKLAGGTGGDVTASVSTGSDGVVYSFNPDINIYQIPAAGIAVQASWGGTVYTLDGDLN
jgi:lipid-binding SYLF domain-containing protein